MSKYEDNLEQEITCPYCRFEFTDSFEYADEDELECYECGNKFHMYREVTVDYKTVPDCELNGGEHDWKFHDLSNGQRHEFCETCGQCKPYSEPLSI